MEFKREQRYIVMKISDISHLDRKDKQDLIRISDKLEDIRDGLFKQELQCVVVEQDWPEFDIVWDMIKQRMEAKDHA